MNVFVDKFGRIVIPKQIRDDFDIQPGTELHIIEGDGHKIVLEPASQQPCLMVREGLLVYNGTAAEDIEKSLKANREERIKKIARGFKA